MSSIGGYRTWSAHSDERDKTAITDLTLGLSLIHNITPKKFKMNPRASYWIKKDSDGNDLDEPYYDTDGFNSGTKADTDFTYGFLAQNVKEGLAKVESDTTKVVDERDPNLLTLDSSELIAVLWKAVQELSTKNDALEARIATLEGG